MKKLLLIFVIIGLLVGGYTLLSNPDDVPPGAPEVIVGITGRWMSLDDENSVMVLDADGSFEDYYDGEPLGTGTWLLSQDTLVKRMDGEELTYAVLTLTKDSLVLSYTGRGNTLRYSRVMPEEL